MGILFLLMEELRASYGFYRVVHVLEEPELGRLFAGLEVLGMWNAAVSLVVARRRVD